MDRPDPPPYYSEKKSRTDHLSIFRAPQYVQQLPAAILLKKEDSSSSNNNNNNNSSSNNNNSNAFAEDRKPLILAGGSRSSGNPNHAARNSNHSQIPVDPARNPNHSLMPYDALRNPNYSQALDDALRNPNYSHAPDNTWREPNYGQMPDNALRNPNYIQIPDDALKNSNYSQIPEDGSRNPNYNQMPDDALRSPNFGHASRSLTNYGEMPNCGIASNEEASVATDHHHRVMPAPFLSKTYELVDDPASNSVISWGEDGNTFVVWNPSSLAKEVLPKYFKHNNFSSFVRQLNTYGFRKIAPDRWEFANDSFTKGGKHLLLEIQRRKTATLSQKLGNGTTALVPSTKDQASPANSVEEQTISSSSSPPTTSHGNSGSNALEEVERLKKENMLLESELTCLRKLCSDLLLHIQRHAAGSTMQDIASLAKFLQHRNSMESEASGKQPYSNELCNRVGKGNPNPFALSEACKLDSRELFPLQCQKQVSVSMPSSVNGRQQRKSESPSSFHLMPMRMKHPKLSDNYEQVAIQRSTDDG